MKFNPQSPLVVLCLFFSILFFTSCSKDSDLMADYIALDPEIGTIAKFVANDTYQISISNNSEDDTFEITVNSGSGGTDNGESGGTVNDSYQISTSLAIVLDVLANDTFKNKEEVVIIEISQPDSGDVVINSDNTLTYTPSTIEASENTFTYTTEFVNTDGTVGTETGTVTVTIIPPSALKLSGPNIFYVTVDGNSNNDGSTEATAWDLKHALSAAKAGDFVYIKAGLYTSLYNQSKNGTSSNPIKFIGYTITPGDVDEDAESTYTRGNRTITVPEFWTYDKNNNNSFNDSALPTLKRNVYDTAGVLLTINGDYVHVYNLQMQGGEALINNTGNNDVFKNIYGRESYRFGIRIDNGNDGVWSNIIIEDCGRNGIVVKGDNYTFNNISVVSDGSMTNAWNYNGMGYFFLYQGATNCTATNIRVSRWSGNTHSGGHGIVMKSSSDNCYDNLFDGFIIENTYLEFNFPTIYNNTAQNGYIVKDDYLGEQLAGARFANNAHANTISNVYMEGCTISFWDWDDGLGGEGPNNTAGSAGYDNIINQVIVDRSGSPTNAKGYAVSYHLFGNNFNEYGSALNNTFYNCTFYGTDHMYQNSRKNVNTRFINCIFDNIPDFTSSSSYPIDSYYTNTSFSNLGFTTPTGTNVTSFNASFTDAANGDFSINNVNLEGAGIATPFLPAGNDLGAVQN